MSLANAVINHLSPRDENKTKLIHMLMKNHKMGCAYLVKRDIFDFLGFPAGKRERNSAGIPGKAAAVNAGK
jgi:hypothetical protein